MKKYRFVRSFLFALQGVRQVFTTEANMRIHLVFTALVIICGFIFKISVTEWMFCLMSFGWVISMEMMNTAIEKYVDFVTPEYHTAAGHAKDIAAGAVLISALFAAIVGLIIFVPKGWIFILKLLD
ncbi:MAG TPA: diacylglycerol kinase family protein [Paludibacter sp.]|nr:diacylglycerol kinase family protein [Paludibacter sp.]